MVNIKLPKFTPKTLLLLLALLIISALVGLVGKLAGIKDSSKEAQAATCWAPPSSGDGSSVECASSMVEAVAESSAAEAAEACEGGCAGF